MKYITYFLFTLILFFTSCNKTQKIYHNNGNIAKEYQYNKNNEIHGYYKEYNTNGKLIYEGSYKKSKKHSISKWYYSDGKLKTQVEYKNGKPEGFENNYDSLGNLNIIRQFHNGMLQLYKSFDTLGQLKYKAKYYNDTIQWYRLYDEKGKEIDGLNFISNNNLPKLKEFQVNLSNKTDTFRIGDTIYFSVRHDNLTRYQILPTFTNGKMWKKNFNSYNYCYVPYKKGPADLIIIISINESELKVIGHKKYTVME